MDAPSTPTFDADDLVPSDPTPGDKPVATNDPKTSVIAKIGLFAAEKWKLTLALWLAVIAAGLYSFFGGLDREGFPPVDVPIVVVDGTYFVDDEAAVDAEVAVPLQDSFSDVDGVKEVTSIALPNAFAIIVEFESGFSSPDGAALLQPAADSVSTPEGAVVVVRALNATKFVEVYDILVSVSGPAGATAAELEAESEKIRAYLEGTNGVIAADHRRT
jgi:multidrug efflux pump subunit AcrB